MITNCSVYLHDYGGSQMRTHTPPYRKAARDLNLAAGAAARAELIRRCSRNAQHPHKIPVVVLPRQPQSPTIVEGSRSRASRTPSRGASHSSASTPSESTSSGGNEDKKAYMKVFPAALRVCVIAK